MGQEFEASRELCDALAGDRHEAIKFWREIQAGNFHGEAGLWIAEVAKRVLEADGYKAKGNVRVKRIVEALGLSGTRDAHRDLRNALFINGTFNNLDTAESRPMASAIAAAKALPRYSGMDDKDLRDLIHRELKKLRDE